MVERRVSKPFERYCRRASHVLAARRLGLALERVRYVEAKSPYPVDLGFTSYSIEKYSSWLRRATKPLRQMLNFVS